MKKLSFWLLMVFALSLTVSMKPVRAKEKIVVISAPKNLKYSMSAQTINFPSMDLNADGKLEKIRLVVLAGASSHLNTVKVYDGGGKLIFQSDFDKCAIGNFIKSGSKKQIAICKKVYSEGESDFGSHLYNITVYDWDKKGKLIEAYIYQTGRKANEDKAWQEFLQNKSKAIYTMNLKVESISKNDLDEILRLGLKQTPNRTKIVSKTLRKIGPWVVLYRAQPSSDDWNGEWEVWQRKNGAWKNLAIFGGPDDDIEMASQMGMPVWVWRKLWNNQTVD